MVTATTNFIKAAFHLQRVFREQQMYRDLRRASRQYYQEQKARTLEEFSKYEYIFSESFLRLKEDGTFKGLPDIFDLDTKLTIQAGKTYHETYQVISQTFDQKIRESKDDPTGSNRLILKYEKDLIQVYNDFGSGCLDIIRDNFGNIAETQTQIDKFQTKLMKSVRRMLKKQVPKFWQQGITWAEINIQRAKKKEEYQKPDIYVDPNQAAVDALVERNLGYIKGMTDDQRKAILTELTEGMILGEGIDQLVKRLAPYVDTKTGKGQSRAELIARTEVMYGLNHGTINRYKKDGIEKVEWLAGPDDRMCPICGQKNGSVYTIGSEPSLPYHPNCRCVWVPYFGTADDYLNNWQERYGKEEIEHCAVYDEFGNLISESVGNEGSVSPVGDTNDKIVIHNHPEGGADLSNADLKYAFTHNLKTIIAVSPDGSRVSITRPSGGWPSADSVDGAWKDTLSESQSYYRTVRANIKVGIIDEATGIKRLQDEMQPILYKKLGIVAVRS